ncbi:hypothetical protein ACSBR2_017207 [Camellia fascicularis]
MSGEWKKLYKIDMDAQKYRLKGNLNSSFSWPGKHSYFVPIAWVNNGEVFLCIADVPGPYIAHHVKTGETSIIKSYDENVSRNFRCDFAYSLVPLPSSFSTLSVSI